MRQATLFCVVCCAGLIVGTSAGADWDDFFVHEGPGVQTNPAICGHRVVWQNEYGTPNRIHTRLLPDGDPQAVYPHGSGKQSDPAVSGSVVVWVDHSGETPSIFAYDLDSDELIVVCEGQLGERDFPAIDGDIIVWQDRRNDKSDIFGYNLATNEEFEICLADSAQTLPSVSGSIVVWSDQRDGRHDVYGIDLDDLEAGEFTIATGSHHQFRPDISGDIVVWQDIRNGAFDIFGYNMETGQEFEINIGDGHQANLAISGDWVVWQDTHPTNDAIYGYNLKTEQLVPISTTINRDQGLPDVSGQFVVWVDHLDNNYSDIRGAALPLEATITLLAPAGGEVLLAGAEAEIQWATEGDSFDEVTIQFSDDDSLTWQTLVEAAPNTGTFMAMMPDVDSDECRIDISVAGLPGIADQSDEAFTVFQCDPALTADLTGDCWVGLADFAILAAQWMDCGNPYDPDWCWQ